MVIEKVEEQWGRFQDRECRKIQATLVGMDDLGTGRVSLEKFYGSALRDNTWQFLENVPYLRQLGALDETDPRRLKVLIPNYINSLSNCLSSSKYYSVCCIDQCEPLLQELELHVEASEAAPEVISALVATMSVGSTQAPGPLSSSLVERLNDIAAQHGGHVPLHGRLFAQWLHHVYPRECPYPHVSGTTRPQDPLSWMKSTGEDVVATEDEMRRLLQDAEQQGSGRKKHSTAPEELPWSEEEELFVYRPEVEDTLPAAFTSSGQWFLDRSTMGLLLFAVPCSVALVLLRVFADVDVDSDGRIKPRQQAKVHSM